MTYQSHVSPAAVVSWPAKNSTIASSLVAHRSFEFSSLSNQRRREASKEGLLRRDHATVSNRHSATLVLVPVFPMPHTHLSDPRSRLIQNRAVFRREYLSGVVGLLPFSLTTQPWDA